MLVTSKSRNTSYHRYAVLAERLIAPVLKTGKGNSFLGSNPRHRAREHYMREVFTELKRSFYATSRGHRSSLWSTSKPYLMSR